MSARSKHKKKKSVKHTMKFVSAWDKREKPLPIMEEDSLNLYSSNDEIGVALTSLSDISFEKQQAAFLFGASSDDLIFRASFECFVKIPNGDESKKALRERLFKSKMASFSDYSDPLSAKTVHSIPVWHNALSMIPQSKTTEEETESGDKPEDDSNVLQGRYDGAEENAKKPETLFEIEHAIIHATEIQNAIDEVVSLYGGYVYVRFRPRDNKLYPDDFVMIGNRFFIIVFANLTDVWLADEESLDGEHPYWYSETSRRGSPVFQAIKLREFYRRELPNIKIDSIVILPNACVVLNDEDMLECWERECNTVVVRTSENDESPLKTLSNYISALPRITSDAPQLDVIGINEMSISFTKNPENWLN